MPVILQTDIKELSLFRRGKVRDVYDLGEELLIVSTDRISCFDVVLPTGIPEKGAILTSMSLFWFNRIADIVAHHVLTADSDEFPAVLRPYRDSLAGRAMIVKKCQALPVECIVRGYLSGSGWNDYRRTGAVCGITLPAGLKESDRLPEPIFTPSTKADVGHDENVAQDYVESLLGVETAAQLRDLSVALYCRARDIAEQSGIIIADTKFEFGLYKGAICIIDEVLTPDSSRFWPRDAYTPGKAQPSFDKQFVRDYLESVAWNKKPPAPALPPEIVEKTQRKYRRALELLTGTTDPARVGT